MKKSITFFVLVAIIATANAAVITVNNNPNSPGQYTNAQTAINAANPGDTIYLSGSSTSYGDIHVNKKLTIFGTGQNPQKQNPLVSSIGYLYLDSINSTSGASGSLIEGLYIGSYLQCVSSYPFYNIKIKRNYFANYIYVYGNNWLIQNNYVYGINLNNNSNIQIVNNIITYYISGSSQTQPTLLIANNLFIDSYSSGNALSSLSNAIISNNIFYGISPGSSTSQCNACTFNNNITFGSSNNTLPYANNTGSGNITNTNPKFTSIATINYTFTTTDNYTLQASSPGHNAGTDATDIGPFGGTYPIPSEPIGWEPNIPQVKTMTISNNVIPVNGTLNISVKAKKQN